MEGKKRRSLWRMMFPIAMAAALVACCVVGCQPSGERGAASDDSAREVQASSETQQSDAIESLGYTRMTDKDAGFVDETLFTIDYINAGSRGCNSCHEDLWDLVGNSNPLVHLAASKPGYGRNAGWKDCYGCHKGTPLSGPMLKDSVHSAHYSSTTFVNELSGSCWNCHAIASDGSYVIWDFYAQSSEYGGYMDAGVDKATAWIQGREWGSDTIAGLTVQHDMPVADVEFDQRVSDEADMYHAINYAIPEFTEDTYSLKVTGANEDKTFTVADLKALPQTEMTLLEHCAGNSIGSYQVCNTPVKGVLLSDFIEACGGVPEDTMSVNAVCADGWLAWPWDLNYLLNQNAILVLEQYGRPLTAVDGYPLTLVVPGTPACFWKKFIVEMDFASTPGAADSSALNGVTYNESALSMLEGPKTFRDLRPLNSMWMSPVNDGDVVTMKDGKVELEGVAYTGHAGMHGEGICQLAFSSDFGETWTMIDVPDTLDPFQWINWSAEWTPKAPGTYVLYLCAIDSHNGWQSFPSAITVVVE